MNRQTARGEVDGYGPSTLSHKRAYPKAASPHEYVHLMGKGTERGFGAKEGN